MFACVWVWVWACMWRSKAGVRIILDGALLPCSLSRALYFLTQSSLMWLPLGIISLYPRARNRSGLWQLRSRLWGLWGPTVQSSCLHNNLRGLWGHTLQSSWQLTWTLKTHSPVLMLTRQFVWTLRTHAPVFMITWWSLWSQSHLPALLVPFKKNHLLRNLAGF